MAAHTGLEQKGVFLVGKGPRTYCLIYSFLWWGCRHLYQGHLIYHFQVGAVILLLWLVQEDLWTEPLTRSDIFYHMTCFGHCDRSRCDKGRDVKSTEASGACLVALRPSILGQVAGGWANREKASWMCQWRPSLSSQSQWVSVGRCTTQHSPDYTMPDETRSHTQVDVDIGWKTHYFKSHHGVLVGYFVTRLKPMDILDN